MPPPVSSVCRSVVSARGDENEKKNVIAVGFSIKLQKQNQKIQTNNHTTSEPHTHVMSNENKFPLKEKQERRKGKRGEEGELALLATQPANFRAWTSALRRRPMRELTSIA